MLAKLDLEQYEQGDYLKESSDLKGKRVLAQEELKRAQESYDFSKRNSNKGYVSQSALESARIAVTQKQLALSVADEAVRVLETYIYERQIAEKRANATEFVRELDRVKRKAAAALSQAEADESASRLRAEVERSKLDKLREQIALCTIIAPQDGEVVYANGSSSDRRGGGSSDQPLIQEGSQVRERQAIINLPDYTKMQVNARVHESRIGSIRQNLRAVVRTEATGAMLFNGIIETVSSVPLSGNWPNRDLKEYATTIRLTDPVDVLRQLKPGLSAEVEVKVDFIPNCINVPVQSIITVGPKQYAFPVINGTPQVREVVIGKTNDIVIEIKDGLKAGDRVLMNPRSILSKEIAKLEDAAREDEEKRQEEDAKNNPGRTEMAPVVPPVSPGQPGGPGNAVAGAPPAGAGGRAPGSFDPGMIFTRLDTNSDGKITADEATEDRTKDMVATMDTNGDSALDLDELKAGFAKRRASGGGGPGGGGPRQGGGAP